MDTFPQATSTFMLPGPAGQLEVITVDSTKASSSVMVICHPHPLHQGTMHNKVVTTLAKAAERLSMPSVRFNFRGVGASEGDFANAVGEQDDCLAVIAWLKQVLPRHNIILAGFSFGSYVAAAVAAKIKVSALITVAPAVVNYPFLSLPSITCPWLTVMGEEDEIVPFEAVEAFVQTRKETGIRYETLEGCSHFFHRKLIDLRTICEDFLITSEYFE